MISYARLRRNPSAFLEAQLGDKRPLIPMRVGLGKGYLVNDAEVVNDVLVRKARHFANVPLVRPTWRTPKELPPGSGLLLADYDRHSVERRALQPAFSKENHLERWNEIITRVADRFIESWQAGGEIVLDEVCSRLALEIVFPALYGVELSEKVHQDARLMTDAVRRDSGYLSVDKTKPSFWRSRLAASELWSAITSILEQQSSCPMTLARLFRNGEHEYDRGDAVRILLAAESTLRAAFSWTWLLLAAHPEMQEQLSREADSALTDFVPSDDNFEQLPLLRRFALETLRLYPPSWYIGRRSLSSIELGGSALPMHTFLLISPYLLQRDPRHFHEPTRFDPSRIELDDKELLRPFGAGTRRCLGEKLAWRSLVLLTAQLLRAFRFEQVKAGLPQPVAKLTLGVPRDTTVRLVPRSS